MLGLIIIRALFRFGGWRRLEYLLAKARASILSLPFPLNCSNYDADKEIRGFLTLNMFPYKSLGFSLTIVTSISQIQSSSYLGVSTYRGGPGHKLVLIRSMF